MGMFSRISDIVQANINAMLDKAEDPEKIIRLIIQEMEETLVELRSVAARHLADEKQLQRKINSLQSQADDWYYKAQLAMSKGKEDLARAALVQRKTQMDKLHDSEEQLEQVSELLGKLREDTGRLNEKLAEARSKQKSLVIRKASVSARLQAKQMEHSDNVEQAMVRFEQYEQRIDQLESQVEAYDLVNTDGSQRGSLKEQFRALETDESIENELAKLKQNAA
jgi:phage shock protein A